MKISVVIASYQRGVKVDKTLISILNQSLKADEIIVVNDGNYEETSDIIASDFPTVTVINIPHSGAAVARNTGVKAARNPVVALIDDDDTMNPRCLEVLYDTLITFPEARAAYGDNSYTNLGTGDHRQSNNLEIPSFVKRFSNIQPIRCNGKVRLYQKNLFYELLKGNILQQPWMVYRDTYLDVGGFQSGLVSADDWDLYLRITRTFPVALTDELIGHHFVEPGRQHLTSDPRQQQGQMEAARRQLALTLYTDIRAVKTLRRTLGGHHKALGDEHLQDRPSDAWQEYWQSLLYWPFDAMVALRTLLILPLRVAAHRIRRSSKQVKQGPAS